MDIKIFNEDENNKEDGKLQMKIVLRILQIKEHFINKNRQYRRN